WLDASLLGAGRQAGNAQLETLAILLEKEGYQHSLNIPLLLLTAESLASPIFKNYKGIEPYDLWAAAWNLDLYPRWYFNKIARVVGLDTFSLIKEIAKLKDFVMMDENQLAALCERFKVPYDKMFDELRNPPDVIKTSY